MNTLLGAAQQDMALWKQRFRLPTIKYAHVAQFNPARGVIASNMSGVSQLYAWNVDTGSLRQLTNEVHGVSSGKITADGKYIFYRRNIEGNELGHFMRMSFTGDTVIDLTPNMPPFFMLTVATNYDGTVAVFPLAGRDGSSLYAVFVTQDGIAAEPRKIYHNADFFHLPVLDSAGHKVVVAHTRRRDNQLEYGLRVVDVDSCKVLAEIWDGAGTKILPAQFSAIESDEQVLAETNQNGVMRPLLWDVRSGQRKDFDHIDLPGDLEPFDWSRDGRYLLMCHYSHAVQQLYTYDLQTNAMQPASQPSGTYTWTGFGADQTIIALWQDATHPPLLVKHHATAPTSPQPLLSTTPLLPEQNRPWKSVVFPSSDGVLIQGWLAVPEGDGPYPTILYLHGGPDIAITDSFFPEGQAWLDHGYAFLALNYRGSTTFGKEFETKIWGRLGYWEVEDVVAARVWLVDAAIAHPNQVFLTGRSYGGYLTLLALGKYPDLWAAGLARMAITDWNVQYEDSSDVFRNFQVTLFGGTPNERPDEYREASPITYVEHVRAPVFILQSRNDVRCSPRGVVEYEQHMQALGKSIEVVWIDEGHVVLSSEDPVVHQEHLLRFASRITHEQPANQINT